MTNNKPLTKKQVLNIFNEDIRPEVIKQYGKNDFPALRMAWNNFTDSLCKDGQITQKTM